MVYLHPVSVQFSITAISPNSTKISISFFRNNKPDLNRRSSFALRCHHHCLHFTAIFQPLPPAAWIFLRRNGFSDTTPLLIPGVFGFLTTFAAIFQPLPPAAWIFWRRNGLSDTTPLLIPGVFGFLTTLDPQVSVFLWKTCCFLARYFLHTCTTIVWMKQIKYILYIYLLYWFCVIKWDFLIKYPSFKHGIGQNPTHFFGQTPHG